MPRPYTLRITEIFPSLQGEGLRQGEPTIFIRLSGCNLRCDFCDTQYAWKEGPKMSTAQILEEVTSIWNEFPADWVCLTGGEPLQQDITELLKKLKEKNFKIQVETNTTFPPSFPVDWYTISPKPEKYYFCSEFLQIAKEVKLVVTRDLEFETVRKIRQNIPDSIPILLQPQSNKRWAARKGFQLLEKAQKVKLKNLRLSVQLHKIYELK